MDDSNDKERSTAREHNIRPVLCETTIAKTPGEIRVLLRPLVGLLAKQAAREWLKGGAGGNTSDNSKLINSPSPTTADSPMIKDGHSDYIARGSPRARHGRSSKQRRSSARSSTRHERAVLRPSTKMGGQRLSSFLRRNGSVKSAAPGIWPSSSRNRHYGIRGSKLRAPRTAIARSICEFPARNRVPRRRCLAQRG